MAFSDDAILQAAAAIASARLLNGKATNTAGDKLSWKEVLANTMEGLEQLTALYEKRSSSSKEDWTKLVNGIR